jgi:murein L,D-transpeptidase YcbB/YkuD
MAKNKKEKKVKIKVVEQELVRKLSTLDPTSEDYKKCVEALNTLREAEAKGQNVLSKDALLKVGGYAVVAVLMLAYERNNPITTKLLSLLPKPKL